MGALLFCFFSAYCAQFVTNEIEKPLKIKGFSIWRRMPKSLRFYLFIFSIIVNRVFSKTLYLNFEIQIQ